MGCIVNGPGEMADADYGYVGTGVGKISYKGQEVVKSNIPAVEAVNALIRLLKITAIGLIQFRISIVPDFNYMYN